MKIKDYKKKYKKNKEKLWGHMSGVPIYGNPFETTLTKIMKNIKKETQ